MALFILAIYNPDEWIYHRYDSRHHYPISSFLIAYSILGDTQNALLVRIYFLFSIASPLLYRSYTETNFAQVSKLRYLFNHASQRADNLKGYMIITENIFRRIWVADCLNVN